MSISALDFDKVERFREAVLSDIRNINFSPEDELDIKVRFANFAHGLIEHKFTTPAAALPAVEVVAAIPSTAVTVA